MKLLMIYFFFVTTNILWITNNLPENLLSNYCRVFSHQDIRISFCYISRHKSNKIDCSLMSGVSSSKLCLIVPLLLSDTGGISRQLGLLEERQNLLFNIIPFPTHLFRLPTKKWCLNPLVSGRLKLTRSLWRQKNGGIDHTSYLSPAPPAVLVSNFSAWCQKIKI